MNQQLPWSGRALVACAALAGCHAAPAARPIRPAPGADAVRSRIAASRSLPPMDGRQLAVTVMEVEYAPGGRSAPHSHPCPVIGYVLEGAIRTRVQGEPEAIHAAGESFYEPPGAVHLVSANASQERPARFLAYFTCDRRVPLTERAPDAAR
ncbi:MAG TPA: cupin domain-containing protein [Gemmatimonadaceae bacterium]